MRTKTIVLLLAIIAVTIPSCKTTDTDNVMKPSPPDAAAVTRAKMEDTKDKIARYYREYNKYPKTLEDLSWVNSGEKYQDAWGRQIVYNVGADRTVRLYSFGADGEVGGQGEAEDITIKFNELDIKPSLAEQVGKPQKKWH
ncbi:MAG: type II secretion system protein GspG [Planctomycetaceae bacterium]|nr:type II secretion system protein GspG [Planctomycetaceae bacterium]